MPILDALLAFSLTMLIVASAVNVVLTLLIKVSSFRSKQLSLMLKDYYDNHLEHVLNRELKRLSHKVDEKVSAGIKELASQHDLSHILPVDELKSFSSLSTEELLERLKRTELGHGLLEKLGDDAEGVLAELGRSYEQVGKRFTLSFRNNSQKWGTGVAFVIALAFNINSIHLIDAYMNNSGTRNNIVAEMGSIILNKNIEVEKVGEQVSQEELIRAIDLTSDQLSVLIDSGFPIGFEYFPYCYKKTGGVTTYGCNNSSPVDWLLWFVGIILTGFLAGLGAPFWYDLITSI